MTITVKNLSHTKIGIRCDRTSILGNPFKMQGESQRSLVIKAFREYLFEVAVSSQDSESVANKIKLKYQLNLSDAWVKPSQRQFTEELQRIYALTFNSDITLLCWCAPLPCHCDVIIKYFQWRYDKYKDWHEWLNSLKLENS